MKILLKDIDVEHRCVLSSGANVAARIHEALGEGNSANLYTALAQIYKKLVQIILIEDSKSILVWSEGIGTLAGPASHLPILTYGYVGAGPKNFDRFARCAGFKMPSASTLNGPLILAPDGRQDSNITVDQVHGYCRASHPSG